MKCKNRESEMEKKNAQGVTLGHFYCQKVTELTKAAKRATWVEERRILWRPSIIAMNFSMSGQA